MSAGISNPVDSGRPLVAGGVVDRIYVHGLSAQAPAQGVDERLSGRADTRVLARSAGEHHLGVGASLGGRGRNGVGGEDSGKQPRCGGYRRTKQASEVMRNHGPEDSLEIGYIN